MTGVEKRLRKEEKKSAKFRTTHKHSHAGTRSGAHLFTVGSVLVSWYAADASELLVQGFPG